MTPASGPALETAPAAPRSRPRDRKRRIEEAAAVAFAEGGYHAVGMQDIAAAVGISAPALYRHFPNKYALFVRTAFMLAHRLIEATDEPAAAPADADPRAVVDALLDAVIATTIELRTTGGIYRWEGRYLEPADRALLTGEFALLRQRFADRLAVLRPELTGDELRWRTLAALSVVASITAHHTVVAARTLRTLLADAAWRVLELPLAAQAPRATAAPAAASAADPDTRRERLIDSAVRMFAARGYNDVTIEDLASDVDLTPSGVYRHFENKSALLLAACERAAVSLEHAVLGARERAASPADALREVCRAYVAHTFANLALTRVYFAELGNLPAEDQRRLRALQRAHVADWTALLQAARPELRGKEAVVLVHASLGVVADEAPLLAERDAVAAERLVALMGAALGIPGRAA
ncbi:TetR/AcrR family transcriptional regulator [Microbacterium telephonicum]|uniref:TetR family transcriptional regulator n=1 Tax=Microbacterium telephonicum TaxID=1714841 RepID=A0A498BSM6_9MICO|nr:TetR family transcriptional regulator [Microbacterium telephonicum]RLK46715.1 TetR family transcriptional regulator [Microbacterium telephonicum]